MTDAGHVLDAVRHLRQLMASLDSAAFAIKQLDDSELSQNLQRDADAVMRALERLENSEPFKQARREYFSHETEA